MHNNEDFNNSNNDFSNGEPYTNDSYTDDQYTNDQYMNAQYVQTTDPLATNSYEIGKRLKNIFWVKFIPFIALWFWVVMALITNFDLTFSCITGEIQKMKYHELSDLIHSSNAEVLLALAGILLIGILVCYICYLIFLFDLKPHDSDFGNAAIYSIVSVIFGGFSSCFPTPTNYFVSLFIGLVDVFSTYLFLNAIYNCVEKVDVNRAKILGIVRNVAVISSIISKIVSFIDSIDSSGSIKAIYWLVVLVSEGIFIWEYVEIWRAASFLQKFGKTYVTDSYESY